MAGFVNELGIGCQVLGIRYQVSGVRYQVSGIRCQVLGIRYWVGTDRDLSNDELKFVKFVPKIRV